MNQALPEATGIVGEITMMNISDLLLDFENPRFQRGADVQSEVDIANDLILGFDVLTLAESISTNGFFANEVLVAIKSDEYSNKFIVVEGNRRLTALKGLCDPSFRSQLFSADRWDELAARPAVTDLKTVPVIVVNERSRAAAIIGYRHIAGIASWDPLAQARYIATLVDREKLSFADVAVTVGKPRADVTAMYRNHGIAVQAKNEGFDVSGLNAKFTYLTLAMNTPGLREFIGAPTGNSIKEGTPPLQASKMGELEELMGWLFGGDGTPAVIDDSRRIAKLGNIVGNPNAVGLQKLRETRDLQLAEEAIRIAGLDPLVRLKNRLKAAKAALEASFEDFADYSTDQTVLDIIADIAENVEAFSGPKADRDG